MHRLTRIAVASLFSLLAVTALAVAADGPAVPPGEQRAQAFLAVIAAPEAERRAFVQQNFSREAIDRRGLDGMVAFLGKVHEDLGPLRPHSVRGLGDRVEFGIRNREGETLRFTVALSPPPESKITGFNVGPDATAAPAPAVAESALPESIATLFDGYKAKGFSGAVIVARRGEPLFAAAHGDADRAGHRALTLDTPINLASDNKMFTAVLIAQLVEEGKLGLDDKVGKHLPDWPQAAVRERVSVRDLLTHTSGLGDYWGPAHAARIGALDTVAEYAELLHADAPAAEPGQAFKYSNNGYVLLGLIAERVTGRDYYDLVRERVYARAGMRHSDHYRRDDEASGRAVGYGRDGQPNTARIALRGSPAGGGYASANDLLRFATALEGGKLVRPPMLREMTSGRAAMGPDMAYGLGFGVTRGKELHYGHDGGSPGASASFEVFPESGYVVIVLSNQGQGSRDLAEQLIGLVLARKPG
jgi:D-alanyl-D-alanine carboxypeptidase